MSLALSYFVHASDRTQVLMGVIGDSISAGFLAQTPPPHATNPPETATPEHFSAPWRLPIFIFDTKSTDSWASGTKIDSNFVLLSKYFAAHDPSVELSVDNVAVTGAKTDQIENQAQKLVDDMKSGKYERLEYVTMMIGANDVCSNKSPDPRSNDSAVHDNIMKALAKLAAIHQSEPIHVMISSLPNIASLGRPVVQNAKTVLGLSCREVRDRLFKACDVQTSWNTQAEYEAKYDVLTDKNEIIVSTVAEAQAQFPSLQIAYVDSFFSWDNLPHKLAMDCFHPNKDGQNEISSIIWKRLPWYQ